MKALQQFPTPQSIKSILPAHHTQLGFLESARKQIRNILSGEDARWLAIVGPCSIHDTTAALEYAMKLRGLAEKTSGTLFVVMRSYYEKSRTASGWKGMLYDPHLDGSLDIHEGLYKVRKFLLDLASLGVPAAAELLDPIAISYFTDLLSWGCIGARTATSQIHRQLAAGLDIPIGIKNSTDGNIDNAVHGVMAASTSHRFPGLNEEGMLVAITAQGNRDAHIVLRGSDTAGNYDSASLNLAAQKLESAGLRQRFLVDCSHGNSQRLPFRQIQVLRSLLQTYEEGNSNLCGIILESFLNYGQQSPESPKSLKYGISITDPCIGWDETEDILMEVHERLSCGERIAVK